MLQVQFKRSHRYYRPGEHCPRELNKGDYVVVAADRGCDLGVVRARFAADKYKREAHTAGHRGRGFALGVGEERELLRLATQDEVDAVPARALEEELILSVRIIY